MHYTPKQCGCHSRLWLILAGKDVHLCATWEAAWAPCGILRACQLMLQPCKREHLCQPEHQRWCPSSCVTQVMCLAGRACGQWSVPG